MRLELPSRLPRRTVIEGPSKIHRKHASMGFSRPIEAPPRILLDGDSCRADDVRGPWGTTPRLMPSRALNGADSGEAERAALTCVGSVRGVHRKTYSRSRKNLAPPTVAPLSQIGLHWVAEADLLEWCNSWSASLLRERLYSHLARLHTQKGKYQPSDPAARSEPSESNPPHTVLHADRQGIQS